MVERWYKKGLVFVIIILLIANIVLPTSGIVINKNTKQGGQQVVNKESIITNTRGDDVDWWPMFHHDLKNTGYSSSPTAPETSHLLWTYKTGFGIVSSPAIVNGKVYIGSDDEKFYCLNAYTGSKIWINSIPGGTSVCSPCVLDGRVYMGTTYDHVFCWDADTGNEIWKFYKGYGGCQSPAVSDGKVYIAAGSNYTDETIYCLNANNGIQIWKTTFPNCALSHVAVYDGKVYVGHYYSKIYCLDGETGETIWNNYTGGRNGAPAIYNGKVIASANGMRCFDAETGEEYWHYQGSWSYCSPAVAYNKIYYVSSDGKIICLDADDGDEVWVYEIGSEYEHAVTSPAVADGKVYVGLWSNGYLMCLNASNGEFIWDYPVSPGNPGHLFSSPAVADGKVYIGGELTYKVYCFGGYDAPPEDPYKPFGPTQGVINIKYNYGTYCLVTDGDKVQFRFDWDTNGSHDISDWSDFVNSPTKVYMKHAWNSSGTFVVKAQARDEHYAFSNWSEGLTVVISENNPPSIPGDPEPENGAIDVDIDADLSWNCSDLDGDNLTYDVYLGTSSPPPKVVSNQSGTTFDPGTMSYETIYYWRIVAYDIWGASAYGPVWSFTTSSESNDPPYIPSDPNPVDGSTDVQVDVDLRWVGGDPDDGDTVFYDVYLEANNPDPSIKVADDLVETVFDPGMLDYGTVYYWKIVARDNHFAETMGPVWHFTTVDNKPPSPPTINGPTSGKVGTSYTYWFKSIDPEEDDIAEYIINWGDGLNETLTGPFASGTPQSKSHTWTIEGTFTIKAKAIDIHDAESEWGELTVTMPRNKATNNVVFWKFLEQFPLLREVLIRLIQK